MKEITITTRKGKNHELDNTIQPGGYKDVDVYEINIKCDASKFKETLEDFLIAGTIAPSDFLEILNLTQL